ncbi:hypothetical protein SAMN05444410_10844 [Hydrobacter penzbergensis]|uniref:Uncharacterized protein n=1 Tax=Hydrobacter penzbergensis TaxID=1235997 RepID=A0A8X8IFU9_9BACT|nr:hypothetical protein [Hydrobacter penzbergensis]SDX01706.1 hypothetical protein SAMN05444410_10844 [Hydrobacter penzbergensis]
MKNQITTTILALFCVSVTIGQNRKEKSAVIKNVPILRKITNDLVVPGVNRKDSIVISIEQFDKLTALLKKDNNKWKDLLPSVAAFFVVLISTGGTIYLGKRQMRIQIQTAEDTLRSQETQSLEQLKVTREQIKETSSLAIKQISANNTQDWKTDTRKTVSELLTQANLLNIEFQDRYVNMDKRKAIYEKFAYSRNNLYLLLVPEKEKQKLLLKSLDELLKILDTHLLNSNTNNDPNSTVGFIPYDNAMFFSRVDEIIRNAGLVLHEEQEKIQT